MGLYLIYILINGVKRGPQNFSSTFLLNDVERSTNPLNTSKITIST